MQRRHVENWLWITPLALLLAAGVRPQDVFRTQPLDGSVTLLGVLLLLAGVAVRVCARGWKYERGGKGPVTDGLYGYVRHPLYVGTFLVGSGLCLLGENLWMLLAFTTCYTLGHIRPVTREEAHMCRRWRKIYPAYRQRVPAVLPRWSALLERKPLVPRRLAEAIYREADAVCVWPLVGLGLEAWKLAPTFAEAGRNSAGITALGIVALGVVALWALLRRRWSVVRATSTPLERREPARPPRRPVSPAPRPARIAEPEPSRTASEGANV